MNYLLVGRLVRQYQAGITRSEKEAFHIAIRTSQQMIKFVQFNGSAALWTPVLDRNAHQLSHFLPALIAEGRTGHVFGLALGADSGNRLLVCGVTAPWTKPGARR